MPDTPNATVALIVRAVVTAALLLIVATSNGAVTPEVDGAIIGAVLGYWLREGEGRALYAIDHRDDGGHGHDHDQESDR